MFIQHVDSDAILRNQPVTLAIKLAAIVALIGICVAYAYLVMGINPKILMRDPNAVAHQPEYVGMVSNIGSVGWIVTAVVTLYSYLLLQRRGPLPRCSWLLLSGGLFTAFCGFDDLFMLHDGLAERIGISQDAVLACYVLFGVVWFVVSAGRIFETEWLLLVLAMGGLAASVILDEGFIPVPSETFFEDMAKLFGIAFWGAYFLRLSWRMTGEKPAGLGH